MKTRKLSIIFLPIVVAALNILIIFYPRESLAAARDALLLWALNVLPGIFPFVVGANVLMAIGGAAFFGELLSPVMKAVFKVPGIGGFALAIGLVSGYPVGTKVVCEMRLGSEISKTEAQRLVAFTSNAGPLFILGAVGAGMFGSSHLGYFLLAAHYMGALAVGLIMRFYRHRSEKSYKNSEDRQFPLHIRAYRSLELTRRRDGRGFGLILAHSILNSIETMLLIGGFIVLFSVISVILELSGLFAVLSAVIAPILGFFGISEALHSGVFVGLVEMTNGVNILSHHGISSQTIALTAAIISFGGLSILFQSINFISKTDISTSIFVICKLTHGVFAAVLTAILYMPFSGIIQTSQTVMVYSHTVTSRFLHSVTHFAAVIAILCIVTMVVAVVHGIRKNHGKRMKKSYKDTTMC